MTEPSTKPRVLSRHGRWCLVLGSSLIVLFVAVFIMGVLGLAVRIRVGWWVLVPAIAVQAAFTARAWRAEGVDRRAPVVLATLAIGWLVIIGTGALSQLVSDTSVDGRHYQSETTRAVARGWDPVRDGPLYPRDTPYQPDAAPKAPAVIGATVFRATNSIDATRLFGATLLIAAGLIAIAALEAAGARTWLAVGGGITLALNPVAIAQLGTAMVDGVVSSVLLAALMLVLLWVWRHPPLVVLPPLAGAIVLLVNTKFTGLVYVGIIVFPTLLVVGLLARTGRRLVWMLGAVAICTLVAMLGLGYNPYVTNLLRHEHPLHPVYGPDSLDIGAQYRTGELGDVSEPERLALSIFGRSTAGEADPKLKIPFVFQSSEWSSFRSPSVRIGGFGPWFSGGLVLALIALVAAASYRMTRRRGSEREGGAHPGAALLSVAGICLLATLVQPSAFLARFAPQLWFVPVLIAIAVVLLVASRVIRAIGVATIGVLAVNAVGVGAATVVWDLRDTDREAASLARLRALSPMEAQFSSWRRSEARRLRENGIKFRTMRQVQCPVPFVLSVPGGLSRRPQLYGIPAPAGAVQLCSIHSQPPPP